MLMVSKSKYGEPYVGNCVTANILAAFGQFVMVAATQDKAEGGANSGRVFSKTCS